MGKANRPGLEENDQRDRAMGEVLNDFLDRRARGEAVSEAELYERHPSIAGELSGYLRLLRNLRPVARTIDQLVDQGVLHTGKDSPYCASLGHYGILDVLGHGGMGVVLRARDERLQRDVALKLLRTDISGDDAAIRRFSHEARASASLRHPNIVTVHDVGEANGIHFFAMEYVDGPTLAGLIRERGSLAADLTRSLFRQILAGLGAAHDAGIVHRDIKPSNILVLDGPQPQAKIADFGLARVLSAQTRLTMPEAVFGTAEYMSPEQAKGEAHVDHRTDLYSAGVVLYEMLTGRVPFAADAPSAVVYKILHEDPPVPAKNDGGIDSHLMSLSMRLMAKRPKDRFPSASEAMAALDGSARVHSPEARRRIHWWGAGLVITLAIAGGLASLDLATVPAITRAYVKRDGNGSLTRTILVDRGDLSSSVFFEGFPDEVGQVSEATLADPDGVAASGDELVIAALFRPWGRDAVIGFGGRASTVWRRDMTPPDSINLADWPDFNGKPGEAWSGRWIAAANLDGVPGDELLVVANHLEEYPTRISVCKPDGVQRCIADFWHLGHVASAQVVEDFFGPGRPAIVAYGQNNKLDGRDSVRVRWHEDAPYEDAPRTTLRRVLVVMVLDPARMNGVSPPRMTELERLSGDMPYAYAFLNHPCLRRDSKNNVAIQMQEPRPITAQDGTDRKWLRLSFSVVDAARLAIDGRGFELTVDEKLRSQKVITGETEPFSAKHWQDAWTPIIQGGKWVDRPRTADAKRAQRSLVKAEPDPNLPTRILAWREDSVKPEVFHDFSASVRRIIEVKPLDPDGILENGDELVVACTEAPQDGGYVFALDNGGEKQWQFDTVFGQQWPDCTLPSNSWGCTALTTGDLDSKPGDELVVIATKLGEYPTVVLVLKPRTDGYEVLSTFWHAGNLDEVHVEADFFGQGKSAIVASGCNNKLDGFGLPVPPDYRAPPGEDRPRTGFDMVPVILILDPQRMTGVGPPRCGRFPIQEGDLPFAYALLNIPYSKMASYYPVGGTELVRPPHIETAQFTDLRPIPSNGTNNDTPRFNLRAAAPLEPESGTLRSGANILVDRNLAFRKANPATGETIGTSPDYWRDLWRPIIQNGKYIDETGPADREASP